MVSWDRPAAIPQGPPDPPGALAQSRRAPRVGAGPADSALV